MTWAARCRDSSWSWHDLDAVMISLASPVTGVVAGIGDPASTRTVYGVVILLLLIGVVLVGLGVWLFRQTRVEPELLGPLERMDDRDWRKLDPAGQRRVLDEVRPDGAEPVRRMPTEPEVDSEFERPAPAVPTFEDLEAIIAGTAPPSTASTDEDEGNAAPESDVHPDAEEEDPAAESDGVADPGGGEQASDEETSGEGSDDAEDDELDAGDEATGENGGAEDGEAATGEDDQGSDGADDQAAGDGDIGEADRGDAEVFAGDRGGDNAAAGDER